MCFCIFCSVSSVLLVFFFQAEDGIRAGHVTGVQTCALPIYPVELGGPEPVVRRRDARTDHGADRAAAPSANRLCRRLDDAGEQSAPAGVDGGHRVTGHESDRNAVGHEHEERDTGRCRHERVGVAAGAGAVDLDDAGAVHLADPRPALGAHRAELARDPAAVLGHGDRVVAGGEAEVGGVVGRDGNAAAPVGERDARAVDLERDVPQAVAPGPYFRNSGTSNSSSSKSRSSAPPSDASSSWRPSGCARTSRERPRFRSPSYRSNPAAMTVIRTSSPRASSMTAPKMMLASGCADWQTISAASFTSNRPRSDGPDTLSSRPRAPSMLASRSGLAMAARAAL